MYCKKCGEKNNENNKFCTSCGTELINNVEKSNNVESNNNISKSETNSEDKNIIAIIGLVVGLLLSGLIGLILSIVGLSKSKKTGEGRTISIIGIIISAVKIVLEIIILIALVLSLVTLGESFGSLIKDQINESKKITDESKNITRENVSMLELDEILYNGVEIEFPADSIDLSIAGLQFDTAFMNTKVKPKETIAAGRIGNTKGGADVEVTNYDNYEKIVQRCDITKAIFTNPKDGSEDVYFAGGVNYNSSLEEVKNTMKKNSNYNVIETTLNGITQLKCSEIDNINEYIIFEFQNNAITQVTIKADDE